MPYKYIGRTHSFKGKTLWEIVGNLKNFGVGRFVTRNVFAERYQEPTYMKILKVETLPEPKTKTVDDLRKVRVLVERTFRGITQAKPLYIESASYKTDYRLIPKHEEEKFNKSIQSASKLDRILPSTLPLPPLMKELIVREVKLRGEVVEEPIVEIVYNRGSMKGYRIAKEGETPTVQITLGLGTPASPRLYKGIEL